MKGLLISISAFALLGSVAVADEVEVHGVAPAPGVVIEKRGADESTTTSKTVRHEDGCTTKSVTHTDNDNDASVTHSKTNC
jgi:hypothetical protein